MDTDIRDISERIGKDIERVRHDKGKRSKPPIIKKVKTKSIKQDAESLFLFMKKAESLGFSFEERQKLFLLYGGYL